MTPAQSRLLMLPASHARPTAYTYDLVAEILVYMSAILPCISWNVPTALPNCLRSWT